LRAGVGIGGCQTAIAARMPELIRILPSEITFKLEMWLVMHQDLKGTRRVRLLFDFLRKRLGDYCTAAGNVGRGALGTPPPSSASIIPVP
jgi:DNA-binding transcriptional LysR family regulator